MIRFEIDDDVVTVADRWVYRWAGTRRPHIHPLLALDGSVLTCDAPDDHPWHHGLWFTIKFVNGENFWEEYDRYGVLRHVEAPEVTSDGDTVTMRGAVRWIRPDRETVVIDEDRTITHRELGGLGYAIDFATVLTPRVDVVLDRTPFTTWGGYGGLTLRGHPRWRNTRLLLSDGSEHQQVHGARGAWCDLTGETDAGRAGVALLDHPDNPRHPVPWYASTRAETYGEGWANFVNAALLWDEPMSVPAGATLTARYRVLVHDGQLDRDGIAHAHRLFTA